MCDVVEADTIGVFGAHVRCADTEMMNFRVTATSCDVSISFSQSGCMNELAAGEDAVRSV